MEKDRDGATIENKVEARQGETSGHMRWVLLASLILVIAVLAYAAFGIKYR